MGVLDKALEKASNQKNASLVTEGFNRHQVDQLLLAESQGVPNTECRKHKE